jgi:acetylornithine deacetylase/succinyl-diaminopimelate desuccinylase-like protein
MVADPMPQDEVVALTSELIRFDTSQGPAISERTAAEYIAAKLAEVGYAPTVLEQSPGRTNVVARLAGADPSKPALLVHGHLDVIPADPAQWTVHPFSGEVRDGYVWGRGAVDMKGMVAMTLAVARALRRDNIVPARDIVFAFVADEENGGWEGARFLVDRHPDLFEGVSEAIGEVGGFSVTLGDPNTPNRAYLVQTGEKGALWLRLLARGTAGHGSLLQDDNPVATLAAAVSRLDRHRFPLQLTEPVRTFLAGVADLTGWPFDESDPEPFVARLGNLGRLVGATLRDTANVTMFSAGSVPNAIPAIAHATVDGRMLPGRLPAFLTEIAEVVGPQVELEWDDLPGVQTSFDGSLVDAMSAAIDAEDPGAVLLPYLVPAATDAKSFARLGIRCFGFAPLRLPPDLDFTALFHGVDERVPVDALHFGTRVLHRLLASA